MMRDYKHRYDDSSAKKKALNSPWPMRGALFFIVSGILAVLFAALSGEKGDLPTAENNDNSTYLAIAAIAEPPPAAPADDMQIIELSLPELPADKQPIIKQLATLDEPKSRFQAEAEAATIKQEQTEQAWQTFTVKAGYNLAIIASRAGVKASEIHALMQLGEPVSFLKRLYPGDKIQLKILPDGSLAGLQFDIHQSKRLLVTRIKDASPGSPQFKAQTIERPLETRITHSSGIIQNSLFVAGREAGLSPQLTYELIKLFEWDIDYSQEVRKGDRFTVVYEEYYRDGKKLANRQDRRNKLPNKTILAAEFVNKNTTYRAVRYTDPQGDVDYFTPSGESVRKTFLRNPVDFARISSRFNLKRRHPILNKIRAHKGVDYAAPTGTPIRAVADGKITHRGRKGGYGHTLIVQHGQRYSTLYAHLSRYNKKIRVGSRIKQGQVIGYVGKSGLATGPHLHYEFRVDGFHRNPLTQKFPSDKPVADKHMADFLSQTRLPLAQLETFKHLELASAEPETILQ